MRTRPRRMGWLVRRFGRRGVFLMMFGAIYVAFGVSTFLTPASRFLLDGGGELLDASWWGLMWVAGGLVAIVVGVARARQWPDSTGFVGLLVPPTVWSAFYAVSLAVWFSTGGEFGNPRSVSGVAVWTIAWSVVLLISGWPDPDPVAAASPADSQGR